MKMPMMAVLVMAMVLATLGATALRAEDTAPHFPIEFNGIFKFYSTYSYPKPMQLVSGSITKDETGQYYRARYEVRYEGRMYGLVDQALVCWSKGQYSVSLTMVARYHAADGSHNAQVTDRLNFLVTMVDWTGKPLQGVAYGYGSGKVDVTLLGIPPQ